MKKFSLPLSDVIWDHMEQEGGLDAKLTDLPTTDNILIFVVGRSVNFFPVADCTESQFISGLLTTYRVLDIVHCLTGFFFSDHVFRSKVGVNLIISSYKTIKNTSILLTKQMDTTAYLT